MRQPRQHILDKNRVAKINSFSEMNLIRSVRAKGAMAAPCAFGFHIGPWPLA
jgi:hypothetical protein